MAAYQPLSYMSFVVLYIQQLKRRNEIASDLSYTFQNTEPFSSKFWTTISPHVAHVTSNYMIIINNQYKV